MKQIVEPLDHISRILGRQTTYGPYRMSQYSIEIPCDEGILLYNTLSGELVFLDNKEVIEIALEISAVRRELVQKRFLVPEDLDEYKLASELRTLTKLMHRGKSGINKFTIFPTTDCNARCYYCYELGRKRTNMSRSTALDVVSYIEDKRGEGSVKLQWFGGEPLFNHNVIDIISEGLNQLEIDFSSIMVTNGYLFDEDLIEKATTFWHLEFVQVPLDGTEKTYNKAKNYIYEDKSPYLRVIRNVGILLDAGIRVEIRLNMDEHNADELTVLADELIGMFGHNEGFSIYTVLIRDFGYAIHEFASDEEALKRYADLQQKLVEAKVCRVQKLKHKAHVNQCMADNDNSITILPDGRIGKCEHESEADLIGSIYHDEIDKEMFNAWKETICVEECKTCLFYPNCIRLKKCAWNNDSCTERARMEMEINIKQRMINEYNNHKNEQDNC